jgi:hypothetical protein
MSTCLVATLFATALAGCPSDDTPEEPPDAAPPAPPDAMQQEANLENVQALFDRSCGGSDCHINFANQPAGALDLRAGASCSNLIQIGAVEVPEQSLLVPGNSAQSYLLCKSTPDCAELPDRAVLMPPPGGLGAIDRDLLSRWIAAGAPGCNTTGLDSTPPLFAGAKMADGQTQAIRLEWDAATDDVTQAEEIVYQVYQATQTGSQDFAQPLLETPPGATSAVVGGLAVSTQYFYVVRARDAAGNTDLNTEEVTATTLAITDTAPPTFAGLNAGMALGATVAELSWAAATDDTSPDSDIVYNVYVSETSGGQNFTTPQLTTLGGATTALVTRLRAGVTYFFVVRARDRALNEDTNTVEVSVTTPPDIFFPEDVQPILTANCTFSACHDASFPAQSLNLTSGNSHENLVSADATQCVAGDTRLRVDPADAANSYILNKLLNTDLCTGVAMPRGGPPLAAEDVATIQLWIEQGALAE